MRRFVTLVFLLFFTVSFGVSISGCAKKTSVTYCNGLGFGTIVGQTSKILLSPQNIGISLNYGEMGSVSHPSATDCKNSPTSPSSFTYGITDANGKPVDAIGSQTIADIVPSGANAGRLCAGVWNRNTGGGIPDYTTCTPNNLSGTVYVVANADSVSSNPLPIYVHPVVTSVVLGVPSTDCIHDPATNCSPAAFINSPTVCTINPANGCCTAPVSTASLPLDVTAGCISQGVTGQIAARVFAGTDTTNPANNISCRVGHLTYTAQTGAVVGIDQDGIATALQPGSTTITANVSNAGSSAGFFSTCPPASIVLSVPPSNGPSATVDLNTTQPITAKVLDTNKVQLTGLNLQFVSTTPTTIPASTGAVTPLLPGAAAITAVCQPPSCNPAPVNQIGLFGNGKPITSNPIEITAPGTSSTVLFIGSTQSQYIVPVDFTMNTVGAPVRLPYVPNSMVISDDGASIYMGSDKEIMTFSAITNGLTSQDPSVSGKVLAVSPDSSTLVITDPVRKLIYLYKATGGVESTFGGVGTHAEFTPDNSTVYITMGDVDGSGNVTPNNQLLIHANDIGWYLTNSAQATPDVTVGVPSVGAFFAGTVTSAKGYCAVTTATTVNGQTTTSNVYYPDAAVTGPATDRLMATNDGLHILGAKAAGGVGTFSDMLLSSATGPGLPVGSCPGNNALAFTQTPVLANVPLAGITATTITGLDATSDSTLAFVTYTGTGGVLPMYKTSAGGAGTLGSLPLATTSAGTPVAPVAGVFSADNSTFFVGTSGDNAVHLINRTTLTDNPTKAILPKLPGVNGGVATPDLIVQRPRKTLS